MNIFKNLCLQTHYYLTLPMRKRYIARLSHQGKAPVMILFYHRVHDDRANEWTISTSMFQRQMNWLEKNFDLISLDEAQHRIRTKNFRPAVCVTFDDGYGTNCDFALPLLIERKIPCTYFVTLENVLHNHPFPHDTDLGPDSRPNTIAELQELAKAGIEIGAHTRTHRDLGQKLPNAILQDEIAVAGRELQQQLGVPIRYFAFPYGLPQNLSAAAFQIAEQAGYQAVCSAYGGYNFPGNDPFHLQRIHGDDVFIRFKNWLSLDPRKLAFTMRLPYASNRSLVTEGVIAS